MGFGLVLNPERLDLRKSCISEILGLALKALWFLLPLRFSHSSWCAVDNFVHLHLHTQYSLLDGANKISEVVAKAKALGQPALAMTDHGNLHGAIEFYSEAKKAGIKPIIGCELYVAPRSRLERKTKEAGGAGTFHLTALAADQEGYHNLCRLVSLAYREGFYFKPRVDHELLTRYSKGLIILSGCLAGELNSFIEVDDIESARKLLAFYAKNFPNRFYLEIQPHQIAEQQKLNTGCFELAKELGIPLVATTDCHYCNKEDHYAQEVLMCISTGKQITDPTRIQHTGFTLYLKSAQDMLEGLGSSPVAAAAVAETVTIAERCNLNFDFNTYYMPRFSLASEEEHLELMATRARKGLQGRLAAKNIGTEQSAKNEAGSHYWERLELEIELISKMGFGSYFLVVSDFIVWAKENGIPVGPGRGSVAGSLVAYAMRITDVDPIQHSLLFERFLNPERVSLPDIDVDFCINGRAKVISYVVEKYGKDKVAQIATFGKLKAKAAIKDVGRALGMSYAETDKIAQLIPAPRQGFDYPLAEAIKMEPRLAEYAAGEGRELIELAKKIEGLTRHSSTHAAGVVIGDRPLMELLPMMVDKDGNDVTQYSMSFVEKCGLVKFDFLGLKTLTVIHTAVRLIRESRGISLDLESLPIEDPATYAMLSSGNTTGVFQLESSGITEMTVRLKPSCFADLVAILALYRPGPLDSGMADRYIERKHNREPVTYLHPLMEPVLRDTYGIMLYQEQIMQLARVLAGYSLAEADLLRKAMGKKNPEEMAKMKVRFLAGAQKEGLKPETAEEIFGQMETFARYGFNKSHSVAYALISFQTAYLKAHYNVEFMAALMSHEMDDSDKTLKNINECSKQKIEVLPPDINESQAGFSVRAGKIRFGLEAVKGIGEKAVSAIIAARDKNGTFENLEDLLERVDTTVLNRRVLESLIKCGSFDSSNVTRREMVERIEDLVAASASYHKEKNSTQLSLFSALNGSSAMAIPRRRLNLPEWPQREKLAHEKEALGFYISGHPLEVYSTDLKKLGVISTRILKVNPPSGKDTVVHVAGIVTALKLRNTKKGDRYANFSLEDDQGTIETIVWPDTYREVAALLEKDDPVVVSGRAEITAERSLLIANKLEPLANLRADKATKGKVVLQSTDDPAKVEAFFTLLTQHRGSCPIHVVIDIMEPGEYIILRDKNREAVRVTPSEALIVESEKLFGQPRLMFS